MTKPACASCVTNNTVYIPIHARNGPIHASRVQIYTDRALILALESGTLLTRLDLALNILICTGSDRGRLVSSV